MSPSDNTSSQNGIEKLSKIKMLEKIEKLKQAIWDKRPILGEIMLRHGDKTLYDYSKDFTDVNPAPSLDMRKPKLISVIKDLVSKRLGQDAAEGVARQLEKKALVSTIDHHGPIDHPFFVNSNIISSIPFAKANDPDLKYSIVLSFASVSANNASAFPRGILFHGDMDGFGENLIRLPILADKFKMGVVYGLDGFTQEDLNKANSQLDKKITSGEVSKDQASKIRQILKVFFGNKDVLKIKDLASQISKINYLIWPTFFHTKKDEDKLISKFKPISDLIYIDIESVITETIINFHLNNPKSLIYNLLFNRELRDLEIKYFGNLYGGFSIDKTWGTFLFWGIDDKYRRVGLFLEGNEIVSTDGSIRCELSPHAVLEGLKQKKIFPSMLLCYIMTSFYYGMKCLGGFCQVHDLTMVKEAWQNFLIEIGEKSEAESIIPIQTKELGGDGMILAYLIKGTELIASTGLDMMLDTECTMFDHYMDLSKKVTLNEMMNIMLPEMYTVLYPFDTRDPELLEITPSQILEVSGVKKKLLSYFKKDSCSDYRINIDAEPINYFKGLQAYLDARKND